MKKRAAAIGIMAIIIAVPDQVAFADKYPNGKVNVFNWGEYIDEELIDEFEEEYGIEVIYDTFDTNEAMYPKVEADPSMYDVICPSDYMIEKMIKNDVIQEIDWDLITNKENIGKEYLEGCEGFDPGNKYCVPYTVGTVGILYNKELVDDDAVIDSWDVLWDETYKNNIIMQDSIRDAFMISLKRLGYSCNTTDEDELEEAMVQLRLQSKLNKAYAIDEVRDKMINGAAAIGVIYSGEYLYCLEENENLVFVVPKEGTNIWYDGWVITKGSKNVENAHKWIDFLCTQDAAYRNFEYIWYGTPNVAAQELIDDDILAIEGVFPSGDVIENGEVYHYLGEDSDDMYYELWKKVKLG